MNTEQDMAELIRANLRNDARIDGSYPLSLELRNGILVMEGEVASIAAKKLAVGQAARLPGVIGILDQLKVAPARRLGDGEIARLLGHALLAEKSFSRYGIAGTDDGQPRRCLRAADIGQGYLDYRIVDGVVTLSGEVAGLDHKRLAGVLAWWVVGTRDVINAIAVEPPEEDGDGPIANAVRQALERDPLVQTTHLGVAVTDGVVVLSGAVATEDQRHMAEDDAWCVFGVDNVVNAIQIGS